MKPETEESTTSLFLLLGVQRMVGVVSHTLDNPQAFRLALAEQHPVSRSQEFGALDESERNQRTITSPNEGPIDVDDLAGLAHGPDM